MEIYNQNKIDDIISFIDNENIKSLSTKIGKIREEYKIDKELGFNMFTSIADHYSHENFLSDILKIILDPNTEEIGNSQYLKFFFETLKLRDVEKIDLKKLKSLENSIFSGNIEVLREKGKIDLLIKDDKQAIIIESKLNNASDMPNQLARYYEYVKDKKLNVLGVVYLTLNPNKKPNLNGYEKEYKKYIPKIEEKLICLSAIDKENKIDLTHDFLEKCISSTKDNETARVYLQQYQNLLKYLGGKSMTEELEKKLLREIYSEKGKASVVGDLAKAWNNRADLLSSIIFDELKKTEIFSIHERNDKVIIKIINEDISIGYKIKNMQYGFVFTSDSEKGIPSNKIDYLVKILNNKCFEKNSSVVEKSKYWVWRNYKVEDLDDDIDIKKITESIVGKLNKLKELYK